MPAQKINQSKPTSNAHLNPAQSHDKTFDRDLIKDANLDQASPIASLGGGYKLISHEMAKFTPEFADNVIMGLEIVPYDRGYNNPRIVEYMPYMLEGTFLPEQAHIDICELDGKRYRLNGQHVCMARCELDAVDKAFSKTYHPLVQVNTYKAQTDDDMRLLYANIDRSLPRPNAAIANSYLYGTEEFKGISKKVIKSLSVGLRGWRYGFEPAGRKIGINEICYHLRTSDYETAMRVARFLQSNPKRNVSHIMRGPVFAAMFATFDKAKDAAGVFWTAVRDGNDLSINDPRLKLRNALTTHSVNAGLGGKSVKTQTTGGEEMYRWCLEAWNHFREGRELKVLKTPKARPSVK